MDQLKTGFSRRDFLKTGGAGLAGLAGVLGWRQLAQVEPVYALPSQQSDDMQPMTGHGGAGAVGQVDHEANGFNPMELLYDYDYGEVKEENGRVVREWNFFAVDRELEVAPGVYFPGWVYGSTTSAATRRAGQLVGQCPGPTLRCVEGDHLRINFVNGGTHPHTIHFHGIHSASMDGAPGIGRGEIKPGESFAYEFDARPFGCHLYHCHSFPLIRHIHKGLYGAFIVDPDPAKFTGDDRELAKARNHQFPECQAVNEMLMVMNAFDTNFDAENEIYAVNSIAFGYGMATPIPIRRDQRQRIYLINVTEFDPVNSLHTHANFFDYYDHGTVLRPTSTTIDTVMQCQAQRGILEFSFADYEPGLYMFHAHQSEFAEKGWMAFFDVQA